MFMFIKNLVFMELFLLVQKLTVNVFYSNDNCEKVRIGKPALSVILATVFTLPTLFLFSPLVSLGSFALAFFYFLKNDNLPELNIDSLESGHYTKFLYLPELYFIRHCKTFYFYVYATHQKVFSLYNRHGLKPVQTLIEPDDTRKNWSIIYKGLFQSSTLDIECALNELQDTEAEKLPLIFQEFRTALNETAPFHRFSLEDEARYMLEIQKNREPLEEYFNLLHKENEK